MRNELQDAVGNK